MISRPFFARVHFHSHHGQGQSGPVGDFLGRILLHLHDALPGFLPEWLKWALIIAVPILLLGGLILRWQRGQHE